MRQNPIVAIIDRTVPLLPNQSVSNIFRSDVALLYYFLLPELWYDVNCNACSTWNGRQLSSATGRWTRGPHCGHLVERVFATLHRKREPGYARLKRSRISGTICHQLESLELSPWKRSMRAFQLQFMGSSSWRHTAIVKSLRLPYLATCSWIRTSSAAISISERARSVRGGCWRDLGALSMLSTQAIHIRCVRRLLGQAPGHLHQHHYCDAGAAADPECCNDQPCQTHPITPLFRPRGCPK